MRNLWIGTLAANTLLGTLAGMGLALRFHVGDWLAYVFVGALLVSILLGLIVAAGGPQRPEGLLKLEYPGDAEAFAAAKTRLKTLLRILGAAFGVGLALGIARFNTDVSGMILACSGCLMVLVAPWIALYARWFRINWF